MPEEKTQILIDTLRGQLREEKEYAEALHESKQDAERLLSKAIGERVTAQERLEEVEAELEKAEDRFESCDNCERPSREEDLAVVWCKEGESGELVDARICLVCRSEAKLAAFEAALKSPAGIQAVLTYCAPDSPGAGTDRMRLKNAEAAIDALLQAAHLHVKEQE